MTRLHLMIDRTLASVHLLVLLLGSSAGAREPRIGVPVPPEPAVQRHQLSAAFELRLLPSVAGARLAEAVSRSSADADLAWPLSAVPSDRLGLVRGTLATELQMRAECSEIPAAGHACLSEDERAADGLHLAPDTDEVAAAVIASQWTEHGRVGRVMLPAGFERDATRALLIDRSDGRFLLLLPHRAASRATLLLRPASGNPATLTFGPVDTRHAVLVPLAGPADVDALARGVVELELWDSAATWWTTLVPERVNGQSAVHTLAVE